MDSFHSSPPSSSIGLEQSGLVVMDSIWSEESVMQGHGLMNPLVSPFLGQQVMTEEQLETLRRQISIYATICQQLVEMHKATLSHQHTYNGMLLGHQSPVQESPMLMGLHHKPTSRQRWTPSQNQLRILERLFKQGNGTPNRQRIKEITSELSQHGQISETNVYNWFQNRKARAKRKQRHASSSHNKDTAESEVETDGDSPEEKRSKIDMPDTISEAATRYSIVTLNGKAWKVKPGRLNVRSNFGENAILLDPRGHVVAMNELGLTLEALQPGGNYTVAGLAETPEIQTDAVPTSSSQAPGGTLQTRVRVYD